MIKRTIEISRQPTHLSAKLGQLIVQPFDAPKEQATSIPAEDIGVVVVDQRRADALLLEQETLQTRAAPGPTGAFLAIQKGLSAARI